MATTEPTCELHLRMVGQLHDLVLRVHKPPLTEDEVARWMQSGAVVRLEVSEMGTQVAHSMLVNFGNVGFAWLLPYRAGRGLNF
ncbi:hypothetical protein [Microtetraspora niveoalba]|uniref:hypothetical protein n=1 Tax=Microtetraspora niveoalba TaxID=46175 RepID=UPI00082B9D80|nr:hypothetical protein [Microtetraspora niveoalba]